jgi:hypothetical protein
MSDFEQCKRHGLPADWCGVCNAALEERERIIALLEDENCNIRISCTDEVVALIKGEQ